MADLQWNNADGILKTQLEQISQLILSLHDDISIIADNGDYSFTHLADKSYIRDFFTIGNARFFIRGNSYEAFFEAYEKYTKDKDLLSFCNFLVPLLRSKKVIGILPYNLPLIYDLKYDKEQGKFTYKQNRDNEVFNLYEYKTGAELYKVLSPDFKPYDEKIIQLEEPSTILEDNRLLTRTTDSKIDSFRTSSKVKYLTSKGLMIEEVEGSLVLNGLGFTDTTIPLNELLPVTDTLGCIKEISSNNIVLMGNKSISVVDTFPNVKLSFALEDLVDKPLYKAQETILGKSKEWKSEEVFTLELVDGYKIIDINYIEGRIINYISNILDTELSKYIEVQLYNDKDKYKTVLIGIFDNNIVNVFTFDDELLSLGSLSDGVINLLGMIDTVNTDIPLGVYTNKDNQMQVFTQSDTGLIADGLIPNAKSIKYYVKQGFLVGIDTLNNISYIDLNVLQESRVYSEEDLLRLFNNLPIADSITPVGASPISIKHFNITHTYKGQIQTLYALIEEDSTLIFVRYDVEKPFRLEKDYKGFKTRLLLGEKPPIKDTLIPDIDINISQNKALVKVQDNYYQIYQY